MDKKFSGRLTEFLESECDDYGIEFSWKWNADTECCDVELKRYGDEIELEFRHDHEKDDLLMCLYEDVFETVREFDHTVRYFWMKVAPYLFPVKD